MAFLPGAGLFDLSILSIGGITARLKLACSQIGLQSNLDGAKLAESTGSIHHVPTECRDNNGNHAGVVIYSQAQNEAPLRDAADFLPEARCRKTS